MGFDLLIHNAEVVTVDPDNTILSAGKVGVTDGRLALIAAGDTGAPLPEAKTVIDAGGGIVMPGLVNTHTHLPMTLFRGLADDLPLETWLNEYMFPAESKHLNPESVSAGARLACAELLLSGTTCCCDGYFHADAVAEAVVDAGLRAVVAQGVIDFPAPGVPDPGDAVAHAARYADRWRGKHPRVTPSIFCHSPYTCGPETLRAAKAEARRRELLFQIHLAETQAEVAQSVSHTDATPVGHSANLGILDSATLAVHLVWADETDIALLAESGSGASHNPESNMKLAAGTAPIPSMMAAGICVGLGTDGAASNNNLDLFGEMDTVAKLHKVTAMDPTVMDAETVLRMATIDGATVLGLGAEIGSLEVGKAADIIVLDAASPHMAPLYSPISQIVYSADGGDVRDVIVAGEVVVRDRTLLTLNVNQCVSNVRQMARAISGDNR